MGVFDGHGGEECSEWAVSRVIWLVDKKLRESVHGVSHDGGFLPCLHHHDEKDGEQIFLDAVKQALDAAIRSLDAEVLEVMQSSGLSMIDSAQQRVEPPISQP